MLWLLDTNVLIALSKRHPAVLPRLQRTDGSAIALSSVVLAEIEYGIAKSAHQQKNRVIFDAIVKAFAIHRFDEAAAREFGRLRAHLEAQGRVIGPYDMLIAAHALALGATLVTDNEGEFRRVPGLVVENWLRG